MSILREFFKRAGLKRKRAAERKRAKKNRGSQGSAFHIEVLESRLLLSTDMLPIVATSDLPSLNTAAIVSSINLPSSVTTEAMALTDADETGTVSQSLASDPPSAPQPTDGNLDPLLMKAILAMDSYNRGYGQSLQLVGERIGDALIIADSSVFGQNSNNVRLDESISFYAIAYYYNGEKIISFRGTDDPVGDALYGYTVATGFPNHQQASMAFGFYNTMSGGVDPRTADISLTGHSLGGGLAGLVAGVYGQRGTLFDNMAFEAAAILAPTAAAVDTLFAEIAYGTLGPWPTPEFSTSPVGKLRTYSLDGDVLWFLSRQLQQTYKEPYKLPGNPNLAPYLPDLFDLHSMASLVIHMYAETEIADMTDWHSASPHFWPILYQNAFAQSLGEVDAGVLRTKLAYSAIDEGPANTEARPFGDTGIRALYDDANDFGKALAPQNASVALTTYAPDISKAFAQFAGTLALNKVLQGAFPDAINGTLTLSEAANNSTLTIDFSDTLWESANGGTSLSTIVARDALVDHLINDTKSPQPIRYNMIQLWGNSMNSIIDRVMFVTLPEMTTTIVENADATLNRSVTMLVGSDREDAITGSSGRDMVFGGDGADVITGGLGWDLILGGAGNDTLVGSLGQDALDGGAGDDLLIARYGSNSRYEGGFGGLDTLDLRSSSQSVSISLNAFQNLDNSLKGTFGGIERVLLGDGNDFIERVQPTYATAYVDAGSGTDTVGVNAYYTPFDTLVADGSITVDNLGGLDHDGLMRVTNAEKLNNNYANVRIVDLGHQYAGYATTYDYSAALRSLNINSGPGLTGLNITDGFKTDTINDSHYNDVYGSNHGDTVTMTGGQHTLWLGKGNDNVTIGFNNTVIYTGGTDRITFLSSPGTVRLAPFVSPFVTFSIANTLFSYEVPGVRVYTYDLVASMPGAGEQLIFQNVGRKYVSAGGDGTYGSVDDVVSYGDYNFKLWLWDGRYIEITNGTMGTLKGVISNTPSLESNYDDVILTSARFPNSKGSSGNDTITGDDATANQIYGGFGNDILTAAGANDRLYGGFDDDELYGGTGFTTLNGGAGNDTLVARAGANTLEGGPGDDTYILFAGTRNIIPSEITLDSGTNTIELPDLVRSQLTVLQREVLGPSGFYLHISSLDNFASIKFKDGQQMTMAQLYNVDTPLPPTSPPPLPPRPALPGSDPMPPVFVTTAAADIADGTDYPVALNLNMLAGSDIFIGSSFDDIVDGGADNDILIGGGGIDRVSFVSATSGVTVNLSLTDAQDTGGAGLDKISGFENLLGSGFDDGLEGDSGANNIKGDAGDDVIQGSGGNDVLDGGSGQDTAVFGGAFNNYNVRLSGTSIVVTAMSGIDGTDTLFSIEKIQFSNGVYQNGVFTENVPPLRVVSVLQTGSGFTARFNKRVDPSQVNLYDTQALAMGAADIVLTGATTGRVNGSVIWDPDGEGFTFVKTNGVLLADTYSLWMGSGMRALHDSVGPLDGNADGVVGGDFTKSFTVSNVGAVLSIGDFVRGGGQPVNVAAGAGIPVFLSGGAGAHSVSFVLDYDPVKLTVSAATLGAGAPTGSTVTMNVLSSGKVSVDMNLGSSLSAPTSVELVNLQAFVPASATYGAAQVLSLSDVLVNGQRGIGDSAIHVAAYFGDTTGNGNYSALDGQRVLRVAAGLDSGFGAFPLIDPIIIGDITGNGQISALDGTRVLQFVAGIPTPQIPPLPALSSPAAAPATEEVPLLTNDISVNAPANSLDILTLDLEQSAELSRQTGKEWLFYTAR